MGAVLGNQLKMQLLSLLREVSWVSCLSCKVGPMTALIPATRQKFLRSGRASLELHSIGRIWREFSIRNAWAGESQAEVLNDLVSDVKGSRRCRQSEEAEKAKVVKI
jgi:hypothetical protein